MHLPFVWGDTTPRICTDCNERWFFRVGDTSRGPVANDALRNGCDFHLDEESEKFPSPAARLLGASCGPLFGRVWEEPTCRIGAAVPARFLPWT